jgi:hypothetical protein
MAMAFSFVKLSIEGNLGNFSALHLAVGNMLGRFAARFLGLDQNILSCPAIEVKVLVVPQLTRNRQRVTGDGNKIDKFRFQL